jgi:hypothetical protein
MHAETIGLVAADRPLHSGEGERHGMNPQIVDSPDGNLPWVPGALP